MVAVNDSNRFDAGAYWRERVGADADLAVVGHRAMGRAYNGEIYARRIEAMEAMLERHVEKPLQQVRVLDIGCGSGFYTGFWRARGVREYVGLDISSGMIDRLANAHPGYQFMQADISETLPETLNDSGPFDVITVFDVLYHIVDQRRVESAVANISGLLADGGKLFIMDFLCRRNYRISKHVIYRDRGAYLSEFRNNQLVLVDNELLFHFLVPPITGIRIIDLLFSAVFKVSGYILRLNGGLASRAAAKIRRLDERLRARDVSLQNGELLLFSRSVAAHD